MRVMMFMKRYMRRDDRCLVVFDRFCNILCRLSMFLFFFFQAEDGIRDADVTGVQTCALPILDYVLGFATELGGVTSHVSIIARNLELPALVGVKELMTTIKHGDYLILDSHSCKIIINPDEATINEYTELSKEYKARKEELQALSGLPATTLDNRTVKVYANVGNIEDVKRAVEKGIKGIGLFRTEFLYMENTHFPTEEEQFEVYKEAATLCPEEVIIRTLDIGGDKSLPYYEFR